MDVGAINHYFDSSLDDRVIQPGLVYSIENIYNDANPKYLIAPCFCIRERNDDRYAALSAHILKSKRTNTPSNGEVARYIKYSKGLDTPLSLPLTISEPTPSGSCAVSVSFDVFKNAMLEKLGVSASVDDSDEDEDDGEAIPDLTFSIPGVNDKFNLEV